MPARTIGLDIGTSGVRAAELSFGKDGVTLERLGQVDLPDGAVWGGAVLDPAPVTAAVRQLWATFRFSSRRVVLGVANQRVIVREVELPAMPRGDIPAALPFQVRDLLPMPVEEAVLDFHPLEDAVTPAGTPVIRGLLVAASREMVLAAVSCVQAAGLQVTSVDLTSFAVLRAMGARLDVDVDTEAVVDIGARITNIVVHSGGVPRFVRIVLQGGQDVTDAVSEQLGIGLPEAELVKQAGSSPADAPGGPAEARTRRAIEGAAQPLVEEIRSTLDAYGAANPYHPMQRVVLSGGGSLLQGMPARLAEATRLPVQAGDPLSAVRTAGLGPVGDGPDGVCRVAVPVGLALGGAR